MKRTILILALIFASCGGPAKKVSVEPSPKEGTSREEFLGKYQAMDHFSKADLFEKSGNLEKAADEYRLALVYDPASNELKRNLSNIYYRLQRFDEALDISLRIDDPKADDIVMIADCYKLTGNTKMAVKYFEKALVLDSTLEIPNRYFAAYYTEKGKLNKAEYYFLKYIGTDSTSDRWWTDMAAFYFESGQIDKAANIYQRMIKADSTDSRGYFGLAMVNEQKKNTTAADSIYKLIAQKNQDNAQILTILTQSFIRLNDYKSAIEAVKRITQIYPDDYLSIRRLGLLLFSQGDTKGADSVLAGLSNAVSDDPIIYYYRARIAQQDSLYSRAESLFAQALALDDTISEAWVGLAFTRGAMAETTEALATLDSALTAGADSLRVLFFTGAFLSQAQRFDKAIDYYDRVLKIDPKNVSALFSLGAAYERCGRFDEAEKAFYLLLKLAPDHAGGLNYLGFMLADRGVRLDEAQSLIKKALKFDPENGAYLDSYAWVLYKKGELKEALKYQEKAIKKGSTDAVLFDHLGDIYAALKQPIKAQENWRKAIELDPENATIKQKLSK